MKHRPQYVSTVCNDRSGSMLFVVACDIQIYMFGMLQIYYTKSSKDQYAFSLNKELLVSINEDLFDVFDEDSITILIEQEIDKININMESGKIKLVSTDLNTFSSIVNKWGGDKVARANKVEELYVDQKADASDEEFII